MPNIDNLGNVLIRSDLNVPIKNGEITDYYRILKSVEIVKKISDKSRTISFVSHLGRPDGKDLKLSLRPVAEKMSEILNKEVHFIEESYGEKVERQIEKSESKIFLLENLRFEKGETDNDKNFSKLITKLSLSKSLFIKGKIEIVIILFAFFDPYFGQTNPELIATGWHEIFNSLYILPAPFLKGGRSSGFVLVPCGKIINGLSE